MWIAGRIVIVAARSLILLLFATAACSFQRPAPITGGDDDDAPAGMDDAATGDGSSPGSTMCQLTTIAPAVANADDTIRLEGTFDDTVMVSFPGGVSVAATRLGSHRASVLVPAAATEGDLTVTSCGASLGHQPFRRTPFTLGMGNFQANLDQANGARQVPKLVVARSQHTSATIGRNLYVVGGAGSNGPLSSVEGAAVNADGSLGAFSTLQGVSLATARQSHTAVRIAAYLYLIGGLGTDGVLLSSVERATISAEARSDRSRPCPM